MAVHVSLPSEGPFYWRIKWCLQQFHYIFLEFLGSFSACPATAPGPFLVQGIDIQNMDF